MGYFGIDRRRTMYLNSSEMQFGRSFLEVFPFSQGKGAVRDRSGAYYIGTDGRPVFNQKFVKAYPFRDGFAAVCDELGTFHIDSEGKQLYSRRFGWVSDFHEGLCAVRYRNGKWTYIDRNGNPWERNYRYCSDFRDGHAALIDDTGSYHIDISGSPLYEERFDLCRNFEHGYAPVMKNGKWHLIDVKGKRVTEDLDRIDEGRNGLFTALNGEDFGYIGTDLSFRKLFGLTVPEKTEPLPRWVEDLKNTDWDSCVVFARHAERMTHFLCNCDVITGSDITSGGQDLARRIGKEFSVFKEKKVHARCSSSQRCITTANCIQGAMGVCSEVETCPEVGPRGTAFFTVTESTGRSERSTSVLCIDHLIGENLDGWYPNPVIRDNIYRFVRGFLKEEDSLTFCINHDVYVIPAIAYATGCFPRDKWIDYCDGILFMRKGDRCFAVFRGREYPMDETGSAEIDTSKSCSDIEMDLPPIENARSWEWQSSEDISWIGDETDIASAVCDRNGRFFFGRNDGYLLTSRMFSFAGDFREQIAPVCRKGRGATYITDFGDILHNRWFIECREFGEGVSPVRDTFGWHYADIDGKIVSKENYELADPVFHGESLVMKDGSLFIRSREGILTKI